jgi:hypothetical protein
MNDAEKKGRRAARWIWVGGILHLVGCGPFYAVVLGQMVGLVAKDANPIGLGLLFFFTAWPSIILVAIGLARGGWPYFKRSLGR